jgi:hypothetical protein
MTSFIEFTDRLKHHNPMLIEAIQYGYHILHESYYLPKVKLVDEITNFNEYTLYKETTDSLIYKLRINTSNNITLNIIIIFTLIEHDILSDIGINKLYEIAFTDFDELGSNVTGDGDINSLRYILATVSDILSSNSDFEYIMFSSADDNDRKKDQKINIYRKYIENSNYEMVNSISDLVTDENTEMIRSILNPGKTLDDILNGYIFRRI